PWLRCSSARADRADAADGIRHSLRLLPLYPGRRLLPRGPRPRRRDTRRSPARPAVTARLLPPPHRGREHLRLWDDVDRGRDGTEERAPRSVRLCESLWTRWHALLVSGESYTHDGCSSAVHIGRDLKNHQHAQLRYGRGLPPSLRDVVEAWAEGQC